MPRTVDEGFRDFLVKLTPSDVESDNAQSHRASIEACLKTNFTLKRFFRTGSFGNGTSISGHSDVDYFACVAADNLKEDSAVSLRKFREVLEQRFPSSGVSVSCPAVRVPFGNQPSEAHEITPADYVEEKSGKKVYEIPNCQGGWIRSSPDAHNAYVQGVNEDRNLKVKPLIRFLKAWKYFKQVPISSFYLELRTAKYAQGESSILYDVDVKRILVGLWDGELAAMQDPAGISGYIHACSSEANRKEALSKLETAKTRAEKACTAEHSDHDTKSAFYWWNLLFDDRFPSYYR